MKAFLLLVSVSLAAASPAIKAGKNEHDKRYVVFTGFDVTPDEVSEWYTGFASPFNVLFGPKPYVIGWSGQGGSFGPNESDTRGRHENEDVEGEDEDDDDDS